MKTSIRWANEVNTHSGSASAAMRIRANDDSPINSGGPSFAGTGTSADSPSQVTFCALLWLAVDMVCDLGVSPIVPARETLYPASPSLQWVPWDIGSPPYRCPRPQRHLRYYDPLRLANVHLGDVFHHRYLVLLVWFVSHRRTQALRGNAGLFSVLRRPASPRRF